MAAAPTDLHKSRVRLDASSCWPPDLAQACIGSMSTYPSLAECGASWCEEQERANLAQVVCSDGGACRHLARVRLDASSCWPPDLAQACMGSMSTYPSLAECGASWCEEQERANLAQVVCSDGGACRHLARVRLDASSCWPPDLAQACMGSMSTYPSLAECGACCTGAHTAQEAAQSPGSQHQFGQVSTSSLLE